MKKIPLTGKLGSGKYSIVDNDDYLRIKKCGYKWNLGSDGYARACFGHTKKKFLHRFILKLDSYTDSNRVDHINGDKLDNRKENLRFCSVSENRRNSKVLSKANSSGYKGVKFLKRNNRWYACLRTKTSYFSLGGYGNPVDAAKAYDKKALEIYGEFARINFPQQNATL